jgi:hypothetical protein
MLGRFRKGTYCRANALSGRVLPEKSISSAGISLIGPHGVS